MQFDFSSFVYVNKILKYYVLLAIIVGGFWNRQFGVNCTQAPQRGQRGPGATPMTASDPPVC